MRWLPELMLLTHQSNDWRNSKVRRRGDEDEHVQLPVAGSHNEYLTTCLFFKQKNRATNLHWRFRGLPDHQSLHRPLHLRCQGMPRAPEPKGEVSLSIGDREHRVLIVSDKNDQNLGGLLSRSRWHP